MIMLMRIALIMILTISLVCIETYARLVILPDAKTFFVKIFKKKKIYSTPLLTTLLVDICPTYRATRNVYLFNR